MSAHVIVKVEREGRLGDLDTRDEFRKGPNHTWFKEPTADAVTGEVHLENTHWRRATKFPAW